MRRNFNNSFYVRTGQKHGRKFAHVLIAEKALGHELPAGAEVHHVNEDGRDNRNCNLVICQDKAYHKLLHRRARIVRAGGNPNSQRMCSRCRRLRLLAEMSSVRGVVQGTCLACCAERTEARRRWLGIAPSNNRGKHQRARDVAEAV